ncbi:MAG: helix-turn-helix domain-containing protein [Gammaproteobacteria bacterium]
MDAINRAPTFTVRHLKKACSECSLQDLCLPLGIGEKDMKSLEQVVETVGPLHRGDHLFRQNDEFSAIYAVRGGCIKSYANSETGEEQVLGFHLPGELVGLDAIYPGRHQCSAVALDTAIVCRLPFAQLATLAVAAPSLQRQLLRIMSRDIGTSHALSGEHSAEERLAAFLLGFADREGSRGLSARNLVLPMPRQDIANYLRLAPETASRILTRFKQRGLIRISGHEIWLEDRSALEALCPGTLRL